ncbi:MAG TPA: hypothetical protein VMP89_05915 [Solirubrobacteraceae bacterium]|nr:hypothetical protein [Solirubrobacteraceae bacterium]
MADLSLGELLRRELLAAADELVVSEETVDVQGLTGPENREIRSELAEALSGSSDRRSRPYLSQRRNVERWARGRRPKPITIRRIVKVQSRRAQLWKRIREAGADVRFRVSWYAARKPEWLPPGRWQKLTADEMHDTMSHAKAERWEQGGAELWLRFLRAYGVPNLKDWLQHVEVIDLRLQA